MLESMKLQADRKIFGAQNLVLVDVNRAGKALVTWAQDLG